MRLFLALSLVASPGVPAAGKPIDTPAAAIEAAKRYTKGRCTSAAPCTYKPERDGKRWRVWVRPARTDRRDPAKALVLYFDAEGNLIRRLESD